ncbi:MAG TPA: hypothetical protein VFF30_03345 [Nitrososphaerales archaeon]|nr:hypothetical protein [Nitrososphaerales archaeon]
MFVLLNPNVPGGVGTISVPINSTNTQFSVYFQNIGPSSATCTFSLFYVYNDS